MNYEPLHSNARTDKRIELPFFFSLKWQAEEKFNQLQIPLFCAFVGPLNAKEMSQRWQHDIFNASTDTYSTT